MLSFLNKYPSSSSQHQLRARAVRAAQRCNKGSSEVLWVRWCENIQLNRFHDKNHLPGLKGAAHLTDCSSKPKLLTGQRKLCLFWPTFSHGVAGLSDFLLQKQYGLFKAKKAKRGSVVSYRYRFQTLYQLCGGRAQARDKLRQRVRWWSLVTRCRTDAAHHHPHHHHHTARIVETLYQPHLTRPRQPRAGATQVSDSSNNITDAWSPLYWYWQRCKNN